MLRSRRDAAAMCGVGIAIAVIGNFFDPSFLIVGGIWAVLAGLQWLLLRVGVLRPRESARPRADGGHRRGR